MFTLRPMTVWSMLRSSTMKWATCARPVCTLIPISKWVRPAARNARIMLWRARAVRRAFNSSCRVVRAAPNVSMTPSPVNLSIFPRYRSTMEASGSKTSYRCCVNSRSETAPSEVRVKPRKSAKITVIFRAWFKTSPSG